MRSPPVYDTASEPGGVLHVACGNRRESVCPACSAVYKRDAGSSSAPVSLAAKAYPSPSPRTRACSPPSPHPRSARCTPGVCAARPSCRAAPAATPRPGAARTAAISPARPGTSTTIPGSAGRCAATATTTTPLCCSTPAPGIYGAGSTTYLPRHLARLAGVSQKTLDAQLRLRYVKVAEYQARGIVHFHAVIRLDAHSDSYQPPPASYPAALLCDAIAQAAAAVSIVVGPDAAPVRLGFGPQPTPAPSGTATSCPAPARTSPSRPWRTTSPSTPPNP